MLTEPILLLRSMNSFRYDLKTFLFHSKGTKIQIDSVMRPQSSSRWQYKCLSYSYNSLPEQLWQSDI